MVQQNTLYVFQNPESRREFLMETKSCDELESVSKANIRICELVFVGSNSRMSEKLRNKRGETRFVAYKTALKYAHSK